MYPDITSVAYMFTTGIGSVVEKSRLQPVGTNRPVRAALKVILRAAHPPTVVRHWILGSKIPVVSVVVVNVICARLQLQRTSDHHDSDQTLMPLEYGERVFAEVCDDTSITYDMRTDYYNTLNLAPFDIDASVRTADRSTRQCPLLFCSPWVKERHNGTCIRSLPYGSSVIGL